MRGRWWLAGAAALLPAAALAQVTLDGHRLVLPGATGDDATIAAVADYLAAKSYITTLRVEGHVAGGGEAQALSEERAMAVSRKLIDKGVDCRRLVVVGFGSTKPVAAPSDPANTRVEFVNVALRDRLIGGLPADGGGRLAGDPCQAQ